MNSNWLYVINSMDQLLEQIATINVGTLPKGYTRGAPLPKVPSYRAQKQPLRKKQVHLPRTPISRIGARLAAAQCALPRGGYPAQWDHLPRITWHQVPSSYVEGSARCELRTKLVAQPQPVVHPLKTITPLCQETNYHPFIYLYPSATVASLPLHI